MKIEVFTLECRLSNRECIASGVTLAIQGLNICSGVITSKILGGGIITPRILRGGIYARDSRGG